MAYKKSGRSISDADKTDADKMSPELRMLMRHEKEQERNRKKVKEAYKNAMEEVRKARKLFGSRSPAYKEAKKRFLEAKAIWEVSRELFGKLSMFSKEEKDATPSAAKIRRQEKEYITRKAVDTSQQEPKERKNQASGGRVGAADMSAKKTSAPSKKKKKIPQYYKSGGMIKKGKKYAYGGRVAKYK